MTEREERLLMELDYMEYHGLITASGIKNKYNIDRSLQDIQSKLKIFNVNREKGELNRSLYYRVDEVVALIKKEQL